MNVARNLALGAIAPLVAIAIAAASPVASAMRR